MAKEHFRPWKPKAATRSLIERCVAITEEYMEQGFKLTLRQLYYQLVARDIVPNTEKSYRKISQYCSRARLAGMMDWTAIEDRARRPHFFGHFSDAYQCIQWAMCEYRLDRWDGQNCYAELWVEKDALASVLKPLADDYHVTLMINRGYSSVSAMKDSAERFRCHGDVEGYLFYLGDLDPSGEDMVRDIRTRLNEFGVFPMVQKIALTMDQVQEFNPPPNPAKVTDPRAADFIKRYGASSWEVDALTPPVLSQIIRGAFDPVIDKQVMNNVISQEERDKERLLAAAENV